MKNVSEVAFVARLLVLGSVSALGCVVHEVPYNGQPMPPPASQPVAAPEPAPAPAPAHASEPVRASEPVHASEPPHSPAPAQAHASAPAAAATPPAKHPYYIHALADLRDARAHLQKQGGDKQLRWDEHDAIGAIDQAINEIKQAAIDDGKNVEDHVAIDVHQPRAGRLHAALQDLRTARADVDKEEDNAFANGLKARALHAIDEAIRFTEAGIQEAAKLT
jgi:hypothetical protein